MLSDSSMVVNFLTKTATERQPLDAQIAENKLVYRESTNKVYSFGGFGTGGLNYVLDFAEGSEW